MGYRSPSIVPRDTTNDAWRVQMQIIASMSLQRRISEWEAFNVGLAMMEENAVRRIHPELSDRGVFLDLVRRRYGAALAERAWPEIRRDVDD